MPKSKTKIHVLTWKSKARVVNSDIRVRSSNLQVASYNFRYTSPGSNLYITS